MNKHHNPTPENKQLYASVKAAFVARTTPINSLNKWCIANNVHRQNARAALLGEWNGEKADELRNVLIAETAKIELPEVHSLER
jgi:hypothetical protein